MPFTGKFVLNIARFAAKQGAPFDELLSLSGYTEEQLCEEGCFVDDAIYNVIFERAVELTGDNFFGLHAGENMNLAAAGLIAQISHTSRTVKEALEYCCQFANLACSSLLMSMLEKADHYVVSINPRPLWEEQSPLALRHTSEGMMAFNIREFHSLLHQKHSPIAIHLPWKKPENTAELERVFNCPIRFEQQQIAMLLEKQHVEANIETSDYALLRILVAYAEEKSAQLANKQGFAAQVKQSVITLVKPGFPTVEQVAGHLNLSPRTLQRRLQKEGFTYKQLLDELRKEFAFSYLKRSDLSIGDVAYLLNYADTSSFTRSFRRWTGQSPKEWREKQNLNI
ncbi:MAG: AraC family transcriptional regulator ligand-binding domain-containing protein [Calditrichota bacterium]